jgi:hypothetical protein
MSDLQRYIKNRKMTDPEFARNFDEGYHAFKMTALDDLFELVTEDASKYLRAISEWEEPENDYSQEFLIMTALSCRNRSRIGIGLIGGNIPS